MICKKCLNEIDDKSIFCNKCGQKINEKQECSSCGAEASPDSVFCAACGHKLSSAAAISAAAASEREIYPQPVPKIKKPHQKETLNFVRGVITKSVLTAMMLVIFIFSFFSVFKVDLGMVSNSLRDIKVKQNSIQLIGAMFFKYDDGEYFTDEMNEMSEDISSVVGNSTKISASDKKELSKLLSKYNILKLTKSVDESENQGVAYQFALYGTLSLLSILLSCAAFAILLVSLIKFILNKNGGKKNIFDKLSIFGFIGTFFIAMMFALIMDNGLSLASAVILPLIFCPLAIIAEYILKIVLDNEKPLARNLVPQVCSLVLVVVLIASFSNMSVLSVKGKFTTDSSTITRAITASPREYYGMLELEGTEGIIESLEYVMTNLSNKELNLISAFEILADTEYADFYSGSTWFNSFMSFAYLLYCISAIAFLCYLLMSIFYNKPSKLTIIPLALTVLFMALFLSNAIFIKSTLTESIKFLKLNKSLTVDLSAGTIFGFIVSILAMIPLFFIRKPKKNKMLTQAPQTDSQVAADSQIAIDSKAISQ